MTTGYEATNVGFAQLVPAIIGAVSALIAMFIKEYVVYKYHGREDAKMRRRDIFELYAAPLASYSEKLLWRMNEIFVLNRHQFLDRKTLPAEYNEYKRISTKYRLASLIGWIRAIDREISYLAPSKNKRAMAVLTKIDNVRSSLADGHRVEIKRLLGIKKLWCDDVIINDDMLDDIASRLEVKFYNSIGQIDEVKQVLLKRRLPIGREVEICQTVMNFLCDELGHAHIDGDRIAQRTEEMRHVLIYNEALIYRDWQDSIGDLMLRDSEHSSRRFELIGFHEFQKILSDNPPIWLARLDSLFDDVYIDVADPGDSRPEQLRRLACSVSELVSVLRDYYENEVDITNVAIDACNKIKKTCC